MRARARSSSRSVRVGVAGRTICTCPPCRRTHERSHTRLGAPRGRGYAAMQQHRRGARAGPLAALLRNRPGTARALLLVLTAAALFACWAASWAGRLVYPVSVQQASLWRPQTDAAAAALVDAPRVAKAVELVISRFSGNLSWVADVVQLMGVTSVVVYCKVRATARAAAQTHPKRADASCFRTPPHRQRRSPARTRCRTWAMRGTRTCGTSRSAGTACPT